MASMASMVSMASLPSLASPSTWPVRSPPRPSWPTPRRCGWTAGVAAGVTAAGGVAGAVRGALSCALVSRRAKASQTRQIAVVGLGNVGSQYVGTRHNVGFEALDKVASRLLDSEWHLEGPIWQPVCGGNLVRLKSTEKELLLFKPASMMNGSGGPVSKLVQDFQLQDQQLVVIYDDLDLAVGRLRLRKSGSSGGQNGVRSILAKGLKDFLRLRVGISRPLGGRGAVVGHVLGRFTPEEAEKTEQVLHRAAEAVEDLADGTTVDNVMNKFNKLLVTTP